MSVVDRARHLYHRLPHPQALRCAGRQRRSGAAASPAASSLTIGPKGQDDIALVLIFPGAKRISVDIDPEAKPDIVGDVRGLHMILVNRAEGVFTSSVLEDGRNPWKAVAEIERILKPKGPRVCRPPLHVPVARRS
jgi:hypothetical protein